MTWDFLIGLKLWLQNLSNNWCLSLLLLSFAVIIGGIYAALLSYTRKHPLKSTPGREAMRREEDI